MTSNQINLAQLDPELDAALRGERSRQEEFLELIASENYVSAEVMAAQGSCLTNKYADGYPGARTYSGCEYVDIVETLARERACRLFGADYANVQPYSGTQANAAAYAAMLAPGERMLGMKAAHGGHITHGNDTSFAGRLYDVAQYGVDPATGEIDFSEVERLAHAHAPKLIVAGFSAYPRVVDWARFREIADEVGAYLLADMAHAAGLIAAGLYPSPVPHADVCTTTTHKTLRGPRGGMIVARENADLAAKLDRAVYPLTQGGPLMHVIAAKAAAFKEAMRPEFADYQRRVIDNANTLASGLIERGFDIVTGGTDNHMILARIEGGLESAKLAEAALERVHIAVGWIRLPSAGDREDGAGLRLGTPAVTTRGFRRRQILQLVDLIADVLDDAGTATARVREDVLSLCRQFPVFASEH